MNSQHPQGMTPLRCDQCFGRKKPRMLGGEASQHAHGVVSFAAGALLTQSRALGGSGPAHAGPADPRAVAAAAGRAAAAGGPAPRRPPRGGAPARGGGGGGAGAARRCGGRGGCGGGAHGERARGRPPAGALQALPACLALRCGGYKQQQKASLPGGLRTAPDSSLPVIRGQRLRFQVLPCRRVQRSAPGTCAQALRSSQRALPGARAARRAREGDGGAAA